MVTPAAKREAVAHVRSVFELSERRACRIIGCVRMTVRYSARKPFFAARVEGPDVGTAIVHRHRPPNGAPFKAADVLLSHVICPDFCK
jgi:hypothetical protein